MLDESADKTLTLLFTTEVIQVSPFSLLVSALAQMQICKGFRIKPEIGQQKDWLIVFASKQLLLVLKKPKRRLSSERLQLFCITFLVPKGWTLHSYIQDSQAFPPSIN